MNILEELKLSRKQNNDKRYDYLCEQFNVVNYAIKLEKYTIKLQQENKQLKIQISAREEVCNRLESNWNKLKEYLNYKSERAVGEDEYVYDEIYNEMKELD